MSNENPQEQMEVDQTIRLLHSIQAEVDYDLNDYAAQALEETRRSAKASRVNQILVNLGIAGDALTRIGERTLYSSKELNYAGIGLAVLDFIRIPIMYAAAYIYREKIPFTITNNYKWMYSGVLLGLMLTAFLVPVTAPIIGFVMGGAGLVLSTFLLGNILYDRYKLGSDRRQNARIIKIELREMDKIQQEAADLTAELSNAKDEQSIAAIYAKIDTVKERYDLQKVQVERVKNKELLLTQKIKELHTYEVVSRGLRVFLAALSVTGLVVAVFFPPTGVAILAAVTVATAVFGIVSLIKSIVEHFQSTQLFEDENLETQPIHESTSDVLKGLSMENANTDVLDNKKDAFIDEESIEQTTPIFPPAPKPIYPDEEECEDEEENRAIHHDSSH